MRSWGEIEDSTVWDITVNGSSFELLRLGITCIFLSVIYALIYLWAKIKWARRR